jgi:hypothetical protein
MGSHSAKSRQESGGVWTVICPGKQHFANLLDSSRPARGLLHTEEITAGQGQEVRGTIGALLLLLTGRPAALPQLSGPGSASLRQSLAPSAATA